MAQQLTLDLGHRPALGRDDFLVAPSNAAAVGMVDQWPRWPSYGAILEGPPGSGKTHLAHVWQQASGATLVAATALNVEAVPGLLEAPGLVIDNLVAPLDERALFHALNYAREHGKHVLLTTATPIADLPIVLPDLRTRLGAFPVARISLPDDALLRGVILKLFTDRQIAVDEALLSYLVMRMPRSLAMARDLVAEIDAASLREKAEVTRAFAGKILARLVEPELPGA